MILLVAATEREIRPTLDWLEDRRHPAGAVSTVITGVGTLATCFAVNEALNSATYRVALQAGICGAFSRELRLGEVVQVAHDRPLDLGVEDRDGTYLSLPEIGFAYPAPYDGEGWLSGGSPLGHLRRVRGGTTDRASGHQATIDRIVRHFPAVEIESMEGAAFLFACQSKGIPAVQLRAVSNYVEPRNREGWDIPAAISNLNRELRKVLLDYLS